MYLYLNNKELKEYAEAVTDDEIFARYRDFTMKHNSEAESHLRPKVPKKPESIRFRLDLQPREWLNLESFGSEILMRPTEVATIILRQWIGLNKTPPTQLFSGMTHLRADLRRIAVNVNQLALAANRFGKNPILEHREVLLSKFAELPDLISKAEILVNQSAEIMELSKATWAIKRDDNGEAEVIEEPGENPAIPSKYIDNQLL